MCRGFRGWADVSLRAGIAVAEVPVTVSLTNCLTTWVRPHLMEVLRPHTAKCAGEDATASRLQRDMLSSWVVKLRALAFQNSIRSVLLTLGSDSSTPFQTCKSDGIDEMSSSVPAAAEMLMMWDRDTEFICHATAYVVIKMDLCSYLIPNVMRLPIHVFCFQQMGAMWDLWVCGHSVGRVTWHLVPSPITAREESQRRRGWGPCARPGA